MSVITNAAQIQNKMIILISWLCVME
uniref:Uncharacterized protein n=1 Tax=Anguilla anguilla TaxID=7936 RepID=A0A0E9RUS6_ANGAN